MPALNRRRFLSRAALLAASTGIDLHTLAPALATAPPGGGDVPTTLDQTVLFGRRVRGDYRALTSGAGEPYLPRYDVLGRVADAARATSRRSLLYLGHLSDLHVIDAQSPGRIEPMFQRGHTAAFHPQDPMSPHVTAAMVQTVSDLRYSPLTGAPMGAVVVTGDTADMHSHRELRWFIDLMDGGTADPASGGRSFEGVQAWTEAMWAYRPTDPRGGQFGDRGFPELPELLDQVVARPVTSPGLPAPWYVVYGNHDTLLMGTFAITPQLRATAIGGWKSYSPDATASNIFDGYAASTGILQQAADALGEAIGRPGYRRVTADAGRHLYSRRDFMVEHLRTASRPGPVGHGFTRDNLASGETWWRADLSPQVRALGLDTCNQVAGPDGAVPGIQFAWLRDQLTRATAENKLVLLLTHHNSATLDNRVQRPGDTETLYGAEELIELLLEHPVAIGWFNGHTHINRILAHKRKSTGFWEVTTASCIDFPQQQQVAEIVDNRDGTLSLFTTVLDHASSAAVGTGGGRADLASRSRELSANDWRGAPEVHRGSPLDRNTELLLPAPFDLSRITDAQLDEQHMTERARLLVHEQGLAR